MMDGKRIVNDEKRVFFELNAETREAIKEVQEMKTNPHMGKTYTNVGKMMKELLDT